MDRALGVSLDWFEEWRKRTGEGPPHFADMASIPDLPPLLEFRISIWATPFQYILLQKSKP